MADLSTRYMGLDLKNPLVVSSSSVLGNIEGVCRCAEAGAGALVLKSLFEEQLRTTGNGFESELWLTGHAEAFEYVMNTRMELGPEDYLKLISKAKKRVAVPVIASLNCISPRWWVDYSKRIAAAGADALELNISLLVSDPKRSSSEIENRHYRILEEVKAHVTIPIAVKIGPYFTSIAQVATELSYRGANALVLFNRFYQLDIDTEKIKIVPGPHFSSKNETHLPLRWISLLADRIPCDLAASTGIHEPAEAIKHLLAGATVVYLCSTLYLKQLGQLQVIAKGLENWMAQHGFSSLDSFRGRLKQLGSEHPESHERVQYIKALKGLE